MFLQSIPILKILYCAKIYPAGNENIDCAARNAHGLAYFIEGSSEYIYGDKVLSVEPGSLLYLPQGVPYVIHRFTPSQCIYIDFTTVSDANEPAFAKNYPSTAQFRDCFYNMLSLYKQKRIGYEAEIMSILYKVIAMVQAADRSAYFPKAHFQKIAPLSNISIRAIAAVISV